MGVEHPHAAQADGRTDMNPLRPSLSMDPKLAASIAVVGQIGITNGAAGSAQLPPLALLMGHKDQIDLLVENGILSDWGWRLGISDRHRPGFKLLLTPHKADL